MGHSGAYGSLPIPIRISMGSPHYYGCSPFLWVPPRIRGSLWFPPFLLGYLCTPTYLLPLLLKFIFKVDLLWQ